MTKVQPIISASLKVDSKAVCEHLPQTSTDRILQKLSHMELTDKEHLERYMRHKWRLNHKPKTLLSSFTSVVLFFTFCQGIDKSLEKIAKKDLEAFIEHEQDRGMKITTVRTRLASINAFLYFLIEQDVYPRRREEEKV